MIILANLYIQIRRAIVRMLVFISLFRLRQTTDTNDSLYLHVVIKRRLHRVLLVKGTLLGAFSESVNNASYLYSGT